MQNDLEFPTTMAESREIIPILNASPHNILAPTDPSVLNQLVDPKTVHKHYSPYDLISLAQQIQTADQYVQATTSSKLQVIVNEIRHLQSEAQKILQSAKRDAQLHHAACNFIKVPDTTYHLYEKSSGKTFFSMLSPQDWGGTPPNNFLGSYQLEYDRSWTPLSEVKEREQDIVAIQKAILSAVPDITHPIRYKTDGNSSLATDIAILK